MARTFSSTKITPANGQKVPAVDGNTTGYMLSEELKSYITSEAGRANGLATLDSNGKLVSTQLPDFANDVLAFDSIASFPATGADGVLYIAKDTNTLYRWDGTSYVSVSADTSELEQRVGGLEAQVEDLQTEVSTLETENSQQAKDIAMLKYVNEGKTYIIEESDRDGYTVDVKPSTVTGEAFGEAVLKSMEGRDVVWNQLAKDLVAGNYDNNGRNQVLSIGNKKISIHNNANYYDALAFMTMSYTSGHKYFVSFKTTDSVAGAKSFVSMTSAESPNPATEYASSMASGLGYHEAILAPNGNGTRIGFGTYSSSHGNADVTVEDIAVIDLTQIFPTDTPTTLTDPRIADLKAYLAEHPEYNAGAIVNNNVTEVRSEGRNLFDEQVEDGGYRQEDGVKSSFSNSYRCKNLVPVEPSSTYTLVAPVGNWYINYYGADGSWVSYGGLKSGTFQFTTGSDVHYISFWRYSGGNASTYTHDVAVIKGVASSYKPYKGTISILTLPSICSSLHGVGSARDKVEFVNDENGKRWMEKKMGIRNLVASEWTAFQRDNNPFFYTNNAIADAKTGNNILNASGVTRLEQVSGTTRLIYPDGTDLSKVDLNGVLLYELATPQLLDITDLVPEEPSIPIEDGGTLTFVNENKVATPSRISMPVKLGGTV